MTTTSSLHEQLKPWAAGALGPVCTTTTIAGVQWIATLKTELMVKGKRLHETEAFHLGKQGGLKNTFKILRFYYRAGFTHMLGALPINWISFYGTQLARMKMTDGGNQPLTTFQGFLSTVFGALGALPVNNAVETTYVQRQSWKVGKRQPSIIGTVAHIWKVAGWKGLTRGIFPLGGRAIIYTGGVCWFNDVCVKLVGQILPQKLKKQKAATQLVAGASCGALVGYISTPFDCWRTVMQANLKGPSTWKTLSNLIQERGFWGLMSGGGSRAAYISGFIGLMTLCKHNYPKLFPDFCFQ